MCRIFGFRSVLDSQVHRSLLSAENALAVQSERHPDGWGVVYYMAGAPHVIKSTGTAATDALFRRVGGVVTSRTVLAHIRKATRGELHPLNCHPFQYGRWVFAHNGDVPDFGARRDALLAEVSPRLRRFVLGETDSEVIFFMLLSRLEAYGPLAQPKAVEEVMDAARGTVADVARLCPAPEGKTNLLTFLVTDGTTMVAHQGGKELFFSTYKRRCADRETCPSLAPYCEEETKSGHVNHLVFSSEVLHGENVWTALSPGELVGVDRRMMLVRRGERRRTGRDRRRLTVSG